MADPVNSQLMKAPEDVKPWQKPSFTYEPPGEAKWIDPRDVPDPVNPQHYKRNAIEPWDYVAANDLGYFEGSAIKYITRWRYKNGVTDLKKAVAFINKLIDLEEKKG